MTRTDQRVLIAVADTGVGISEHELPRVFERFHRVEGAQGRSHEGSGIGLALVQELVKLHGGELTAPVSRGEAAPSPCRFPWGSRISHPNAWCSRPPTGSRGRPRRYVEEALRWLPGESLRNSDDGSAPLRLEYESEGDSVTNIGRVLLADDNADMREYAKRLLAQRWLVETVSNGREALEAARVRRPDVIVTDVMMPELDGFGLLRELRADPSLQTIPVIMLSARAGEEARIEGLAASADDYLVKPFSARDLLARVDVAAREGANPGHRTAACPSSDPSLHPRPGRGRGALGPDAHLRVDQFEVSRVDWRPQCRRPTHS